MSVLIAILIIVAILVLGVIGGGLAVAAYTGKKFWEVIRRQNR